MRSKMAAPLIRSPALGRRRRRRMKLPSAKAPQSNLLYKVAFFIALLSFLPSQAPRHWVGQTISAGFWELLRLLFLGVAISYGLFSRRNLDSDFGNDPPAPPTKADDAATAVQCFASRVLHVFPVFDADDEVDGGKLQQAWFSLESIDEVSNINGSKESAALPSPIPWRSRSGKLEERKKAATPARSHSLPVAFDAGELLRKTTPSFQPPRKLSPSQSLPREVRPRTSCNYNYNYNCNCNSTPPPPPPTLPATMDGATKMPKRLMDEVSANRTREEVVEESVNKEAEDEVRGGEEEDGGEGENEVDKKADEFIAKFREEIRRQRIESIKSSTRQRSDRKTL